MPTWHFDANIWIDLGYHEKCKQMLLDTNKRGKERCFCDDGCTEDCAENTGPWFGARLRTRPPSRPETSASEDEPQASIPSLLNDDEIAIDTAKASDISQTNGHPWRLQLTPTPAEPGVSHIQPSVQPAQLMITPATSEFSAPEAGMSAPRYQTPYRPLGHSHLSIVADTAQRLGFPGISPAQQQSIAPLQPVMNFNSFGGPSISPQMTEGSAPTLHNAPSIKLAFLTAFQVENTTLMLRTAANSHSFLNISLQVVDDIAFLFQFVKEYWAFKQANFQSNRILVEDDVRARYGKVVDDLEGFPRVLMFNREIWDRSSTQGRLNVKSVVIREDYACRI